MVEKKQHLFHIIFHVHKAIDIFSGISITDIRNKFIFVRESRFTGGKNQGFITYRTRIRENIPVIFAICMASHKECKSSFWSCIHPSEKGLEKYNLCVLWGFFNSKVILSIFDLGPLVFFPTCLYGDQFKSHFMFSRNVLFWNKINTVGIERW